MPVLEPVPTQTQTLLISGPQATVLCTVGLQQFYLLFLISDGFN